MTTTIGEQKQLAHGLDGKLAAPDWPPLTMDEVRTLLDRYPATGEARTILTTSPRPFSAASVVECERNRFFIKRHPRMARDRQGLEEEHRFMAHLRARGAPVPLVLATETGETAVETDAWTYEVHEVPAGVDLYCDVLSWTPFLSVEHARSAGEMMARMHRWAGGFDAAPRRPWPLVASFTLFAAADPVAEFEQYAAARPALRGRSAARDCFKAAHELLQPLHAELMPLLKALEPLWTHNDLHGSNLLWSDAGDRAQATAVIDFGLADRTFTAHDIAQAIERSIGEWLELTPGNEAHQRIPIHYDHLAALLAGYESVRPLDDAEAAALAPMAALCHAEFALTEADYFGAALHSEEKTRIALEDYLVGRARWFAQGQGRELVEWLRRWARERINGKVDR